MIEVIFTRALYGLICQKYADGHWRLYYRHLYWDAAWAGADVKIIAIMIPVAISIGDPAAALILFAVCITGLCLAVQLLLF